MENKPVHPGVILETVYMAKHNLTMDDVAEALELHKTVVRKLILGEFNIYNKLAERLAKFFGTTSEYWMTLQREYTLGYSPDSNRVNQWEKTNNSPIDSSFSKTLSYIPTLRHFLNKRNLSHA